MRGGSTGTFTIFIVLATCPLPANTKFLVDNLNQSRTQRFRLSICMVEIVVFVVLFQNKMQLWELSIDSSWEMGYILFVA